MMANLAATLSCLVNQISIIADQKKLGVQPWKRKLYIDKITVNYIKKRNSLK